MSAPGGAGALRVLLRPRCAACPREQLFRLCHAAAASLLPGQCRNPYAAPQSPPSLAAPVRRAGRVIVCQPAIRGCRPAASAEGLNARPASSGCGGSQSLRFLLVPASPASAPAPARCCHAKSNPGQAAVPQSAVPPLAGSVPPAPAEPAPCAQASLCTRHGLPGETPRGPGAEPVMTGSGGGGMVNGRQKARRESRVNVLLKL